MSITAGLPRIQEKANHKSFHQRHNSGELDVFEAAGYFSASNEIYGTSFTPQQKMMRASGRMSLDIPVMSSKRTSIPTPTHHQKVLKDEKKFKQPNSPGGKLASFLNSLFNQTSSKTKKSKISSSKSMKDDQDHEIGRRKRRSSMSHFQSVNTTSSNYIISSDSKSSSFYSSSSSSEKRLPCAKVPTKISPKEIHSHSDQNDDVIMNTSSKIKNDINVHVKSSSSHKKVHNDENTETSWLDEKKFKFQTPNENSSEKFKNTFANKVSGGKINHSKDSTNFKNFINDEDDGADSDSSSDLFELQNYDLVSCYSSDLPVYETTQIDAIKRGAPIVGSVM
ncbi:Protein BIG GRAIN 1-like protein E [Heracleum sosnowskyi]|uniref:Protein BIG GRAIN 1-like protein E n=1 Tax=Heracleum sosnowskyi TaxID=360622 RepID=A0AAD8H7S4_9APIA|nr:Protein BIG GRAIN 1-like protein E [Heracleum sosnowskyi]